MEADYKCRNRQKIVNKQIFNQFPIMLLIAFATTLGDNTRNIDKFGNRIQRSGSASGTKAHKGRIRAHSYSIKSVDEKPYPWGSATFSKPQLIGAIKTVHGQRLRITGR